MNELFLSYPKVLYSDNGVTWNPVTNRTSHDVIFIGNNDNESKVLNELPSPINTIYLRLQPVTWLTHISLRWDVVGCA